MRSKLLLGTALAMLLAPPMISAQQSTMPGQQQPIQAQPFAEQAAASGLFEVQSSRMALEKVKDQQRIQQFAQRMIDDHTAANDQLKQVAESQDIRIPQQLDAEHQQKMQELQGLSGEEFQRRYMTQQVQGHQKAVDLFQHYAQQGDNQGLKSFAQQTLPRLEEHLQMAQELQSSLQPIASATGQPSMQGSGMTGGAGGAAMGQPMIAGLGGTSVEELLGKPVVGSDGQRIGEVEDIIFQSQNGPAQQAILASGDFLGIGGKRVAVDLQNLRVEGDHLVAPNLTQASIQGMSEYQYPDDAVALSRRSPDSGEGRTLSTQPR